MLSRRQTLIASALLACGDAGDPSRCFDVCGEGTRCEAGRCIAAAPSEPEPVAAAPAPVRKGKGRRRGRGASDDDDGSDAPAPAGGYTPVDDSRVPRYDASATVVLDPAAGSERLDDTTVRAHLRKLEPSFDRCIADAVTAGVTVGSGRVDFVFGLAPSGKVTGVTAKAPAAIRDSGVIPCLRTVVFEHRFPDYDGPPMGVDYSFEID
ncbi:MAG: hypothetical protein K1X88_15345 [Nannocystaceae bacterium]|nr:hypothetical protein [Nannocystaceae bacterium]